MAAERLEGIAEIEVNAGMAGRQGQRRLPGPDRRFGLPGVALDPAQPAVEGGTIRRLRGEFRERGFISRDRLLVPVELGQNAAEPAPIRGRRLDPERCAIFVRRLRKTLANRKRRSVVAPDAGIVGRQSRGGAQQLDRLDLAPLLEAQNA
jgi:hypothetical protein